MRGLALAGALLLAACSSGGGGADACRTIEHARCDRQAACEDWSDETRDECRTTRDAECHAGAIAPVRDASDADVKACAAAIRAADCAALDDPFALPGCESLGGAPPDAGAPADAGPPDAAADAAG